MKKAFPCNERRILNWAEEDRPREKLWQRGKAALTDSELLAILIGSGTVTDSAVDVAQNLLKHAGHNLQALARMSPKELMKIKGIGQVKAIILTAAMELGRRKKENEGPKRIRVTSSSQVYQEMRPYLLDKPHEEFWVIFLNRANHIISTLQISLGGVSGTVVDTKLVFKHAIEHLASSVILVHNHPSGRLAISEEDSRITEDLVNMGRFLGIPVLDHLIFTDNGYFSFADEGLLVRK